MRYIDGNGYGVTSAKKTGFMKLVFELRTIEGADALGKGSTLALVLTLGKPSPKLGMEPVRGIKIDWDDSATSKKVGIVIQMPKQGPEQVYVTRQDVRVTIKDTIHISEYKFYSPGFHLSRLLFVDDMPELPRIDPYLD